MAYRLTRWPLLLRDNPAKAKREILEAVVAVEPTIVSNPPLGCTHRASHHSNAPSAHVHQTEDDLIRQ